MVVVVLHLSHGKKVSCPLFRLGQVCLLLPGLLLFGLFSDSTLMAKDGASAGENKLYELAIEGQLSDELVSEFYDYAIGNAKEKIQAPDEFWEWLARNKELQRGLLVGLHPDYNPHVVERLQELRGAFGSKVQQYPHLALAFSFVYGAAKEGSIRRKGLASWVGKNRPVPSCVESFAYYIKNKDKLLYPLNQLPWPLLIYVADNDVPLAERDWALNRYEGKSINDLRRLHSEIKHIKGASAKVRSKLGGAPMALPRMKTDGGVCSQQAYYSSRVLKCLGVPSIRITVPGHVYEGWLVKDQGLKMKIGSNLGRKNGDYFRPLTRETLKQHNFSLLIRSIDHSYAQYLKSKIACHVFKMLPDHMKKQAMGLLDKSIEANPYVIDVWLEYAQACEKGVFPIEAGWPLFDKAYRKLYQYPLFICTLLRQLINAQLDVTENISDNQYNQINGKFRKVFAKYYNKHDLELGLLKTQADFLIRAKGPDVLLDNTLKWFKKMSISLAREKSLFEHIHNIFIRSNDKIAIEKLLSTEHRRRKQLALKGSKKTYERHYSCYVQVAKAYIAYLKEAGNDVETSEIYLELDRFNNENLHNYDFLKVIKQGRVLGDAKKQVAKISHKVQGCYVWRILCNLPKGYNLHVQAKHAVAGKDGAFHFTLWSDKDRNGVPDTKVAVSPLMTAKNKDQWSDWNIKTTDRTHFIGVAMKTKTSLYYQMGGKLEGYYGLSDRVFYSKIFGQSPEKSAQARYSNLRVEISR